jgi:RNA polymerase sigma-70 factor (ECF subfamily)
VVRPAGRAGQAHAPARRLEPATWQAFEQTALRGRLAKDVAEQLGLSVVGVYVARSRVLKMLQDEVSALEAESVDP